MGDGCRKMKIWVLKGDINKNPRDVNGQKRDIWQESRKSAQRKRGQGGFCDSAVKDARAGRLGGNVVAGWGWGVSQRKQQEQRRGGRKWRHQSESAGRKDKTPLIMFCHTAREGKMLSQRPECLKTKGKKSVEIIFLLRRSNL